MRPTLAAHTIAAALAVTSVHRIDAATVRTYAFTEKTPPAEIQLWNVGDNATDYGVHKWTERSVASVMGRYEVRGNPLLVDVEHNGAKVEGEPAITGGYARLEIRAGAPWLVFDWSRFAVEQIAAGERRFMSPEYDVDKDTGEILALYRVSLVADPGTHRARMLAAASPKRGHNMDPKLAAIMAILGSVSDPAAAIEAIKSLVANLDGGESPPAAMAADEEPAPMTAAAEGGAGDAPEKKDPPVAASAAPVATPAAAAPIVVAAQAAAATLPVDSSATVRAAASAAVTQIENAQRDHLIATQGEKLDPSIRRWASSQPLAVVSGLLAATPAKIEPVARVAATRGATQGTSAANVVGLEGRDLEDLQRAMGTFKASAPEPHTRPDGTLVIPAVPPRLLRERHAAALAAGKDGK